MLPAASSKATDMEDTVIESGPSHISQASARDSIVTVRLSDSTPTSIPDHERAVNAADECAIEDSADMVDIRLRDPTPQQSPIEKDTPESSMERFPQMQDITNATQVDAIHVEEDSMTILPEEAKVIQRIHRQSTISMLSAVDEASSDGGSFSVRSRSDSSGTFSSLGSANVDWLELEKKEEEAPRDEASDEVNCHFYIN